MRKCEELIVDDVAYKYSSPLDIENEEFLYKYYSPTPYNFEALREKYFYFSRVCKLNDPFDCSYELVRPYRQFIKDIGFNNKDDEAANRMREYGTCSFSATGNSKNLWALYSNNYKGFCVAFDNSKIKVPHLVSWNDSVPIFSTISDEITCVQPYSFMVKGYVGYLEEPKNLDDFSAVAYRLSCGNGSYKEVSIANAKNDPKLLDNVFIALCFTKEKDSWVSEKEIRLFIGNQEKFVKIGDGNGLKIGYSVECVKKIIFGHNFEYSNYSQLIKIIDEYPNADYCITSPEANWNIGLRLLDKEKLYNLTIQKESFNLSNYIKQ